MKKGYLVAYLGGAATMGIVISQGLKMAKKYGQPIGNKRRPSLDNIEKTAEKGLDFIAKKMGK